MEKHKENDLLCGNFLVVCLKGMNLCLLVIRVHILQGILKMQVCEERTKKKLTKATKMECLCDTI